MVKCGLSSRVVVEFLKGGSGSVAVAGVAVGNFAEVVLVICRAVNAKGGDGGKAEGGVGIFIAGKVLDQRKLGRATA